MISEEKKISEKDSVFSIARKMGIGRPISCVLVGVLLAALHHKPLWEGAVEGILGLVVYSLLIICVRSIIQRAHAHANKN